jgi:F0F1-type ATP synthase membrane subunit a
MIFFYGPLTQFELLEKNKTCSFDFFSAIFGISEFDVTLIFITIFLFFFQFYTFQNNQIKIFNNISIGFENIIKNIITKKNFNYTDLLITYFSIIFAANITGLIPYSQTITAQILFTLILSLIIILTI